MNHNYTLHVTENELTTSIVVVVGRHQTQVTSAQKDDHVMVYVWAEVNKKTHEWRCADMAEAREKVWSVARQIGRNEAV